MLAGLQPRAVPFDIKKKRKPRIPSAGELRRSPKLVNFSKFAILELKKNKSRPVQRC